MRDAIENPPKLIKIVEFNYLGPRGCVLRDVMGVAEALKVLTR